MLLQKATETTKGNIFLVLYVLYLGMSTALGRDTVTVTSKYGRHYRLCDSFGGWKYPLLLQKDYRSLIWELLMKLSVEAILSSRYRDYKEHFYFYSRMSKSILNRISPVIGLPRHFLILIQNSHSLLLAPFDLVNHRFRWNGLVDSLCRVHPNRSEIKKLRVFHIYKLFELQIQIHCWNIDSAPSCWFKSISK